MKGEKVKLRVQGIMNSQVQSGAYALILSEEGMRRIPIIVGAFEAQSIAIALERLTPPRPLTHDLFIAYMKETGFELKEIYIYKFTDGVFYSKILFYDDTRKIQLDSRTSDAIAIALRTESEIYTTETIMQKCGIVIEDNDSIAEKETDLFFEDNLQDLTIPQKQLRNLPNKEIERLMQKAVEQEDYEFAKTYKDELTRREKEK